MVIVPGVRVSIDEHARTARVEALPPVCVKPLAFTVRPSPDGRGWDVRDPVGGAFAWRDSFDAAVRVAVASANGALGSERRISLP
jgi:hypothetical protein